LAPNQAFDESLGLRVKLPGEDLFFGLFGGVTQNLSPASSTIYQEMVNGGHAKEDLYWESAPHWTASLWGKAPGMNDMRFSLSGGQRYNDHTTVTQGELAILSNFHRVPVAARLQHKSEKGEGIAFDRETTRLQIDAELSDRVTGFLAYEKDAIQYGNAGVRSDGVWLGARWDFGAGKGRLTVDHVFNQGYGKDSPLRPYMPDAAAAITRLLATGVEAAQEADDLLQGMAQGATQAEIDALINRLSHALSSLDGPGAAALVGSMDGLTDLQRLWLTDFLTRTFPAGSLREEEIRRVLEAAFGADLPEVERMQLLGDLKGNLSDALELSRKLADPEVWEAAAIAAGRTALVQALAKDLEVDIPLIDKTITMKTHAPVLIAAMGALNTRLSPLHPMTSEDASAWLISEAGHYMGLGGNATTDEIAAALLSQGVETLVAGVTRQIDEAIELQLSQGAYDPAVAAQLILGQLSPLSAAAMRELYGPNLEGLLPPPGTAADAVKAYMHERLTGDVAAALRTRMGPAAEQAVAEMAAWAGEVISREINLTTIHLMLASEELERMMVDKGKKASDLGVDMLQNSFTRLDARDRRKLAASLTGARQTLQSRQAKEDQRLGEKLTELGRARLEAMQLDPSWPKGLEIVIEDQHWAPLLASYGDTSFLEMLQALADKRRASKKTEPLIITFSYDAKRTMGGFVATRREGGNLDFALGPVKNPREAQMRLGWLPDYLK
jgi:hypothetical protein